MKHILWITSWYPNHYDKANGNFIRRHAQALSLYAKVHVLFVTPANDADADYLEEQVHTDGNLTEQLVYYRADESSFTGRLQSRWRYMKLARHFVKQYIQEHGLPDHVHAQVPVRAGLVALWIKRKYNIDYALTEHYGIYNREVVDPFEDRSFFYRRAVKNIIRKAKPFLPVSKKIAEDINRIVVKKEYTVIPNVVDTTLFKYEEKNPSAKFRFLHVSNMIPLKNIEGIIDAVEKLSAQRSDFKLTITGSYRPELLEYARQKNVLDSIITFTGEVPYTQVAQEMKQSDAFILFSNTENNPCVLLESLCAGLPVISSRVGGVPEIVNDTNGLLVEARNTSQLVAAMNDLMNRYTKYNLQNISATAGAKYSYEAIGNRILESYSL